MGAVPKKHTSITAAQGYSRQRLNNGTKAKDWVITAYRNVAPYAGALLNLSPFKHKLHHSSHRLVRDRDRLLELGLIDWWIYWFPTNTYS